MRINIFDCPVDAISMEETLGIVKNTIETKGHIHQVVVNVAKLVNMKSDPQLRESVIKSDLINIDGQGVVWGARFLGHTIPERVNGTNLMEDLVAMSHKNGYKIFFFGAKEDIIQKVVDVYSKKYSSNIIAGFRNGYFSKDQEKEIAQQIADSGANILFVAITSPIKENFLYENKNILSKVNFIMGVGGSFDVVAGKVKRAPVWMQNSGLEWFFRLIQEPRRLFKRYFVTNVKFIQMVFSAKFLSR
jgi:N-acetylglucosaminyldiphosphoundecaprenol N-acetyl-beta-D-mannosaminyltransferase